MTRHREVERKFNADPGALLPDLSVAAAAVSEAAELQLDATYFDTADTRLARHRITLRRRTGGGDAGWHLKLPAGLDARTEVRLPLGRATRTVPRALVGEIHAIVRDRPLIPIAILHTTRIERRLLDDDGNTLATIADDTVLGQRLLGGAVEESTWREIEVELVDGDRSLLDTVSRQLCAAGLTPSESSSKLARVLGDSAPLTPDDLTHQRDRVVRATAGAVVLAHLRDQVDQMVARDRGARSDEPDAVHQMRVATRRLLSALATYRTLLDGERTSPVRAELKWLEAVLGRVRDTELLQWRLQDLVATLPDALVLGPVGRRVELELGNRRRAALADLVSALDDDRHVRLMDALDSLLADPPFTARAGKPARVQLPVLVGHAARRVDLAASAITHNRMPQARDRGMHKVAKRAIRARYAAESAVPVAGKPAIRLANRMEALQDILGEHDDSVAARVLLLELAAAAQESGENGFTYGLLYAQERANAVEVRRAYGAAVRRTATTRARRWTR